MLAIAALVSAFLLAPPTATEARADSLTSSAVQPIEWAAFGGPDPSDPDFTRLQSILHNSNRYALTTYWESTGYASQPGPYLDLGALAGPAYEAFALSVSLATDAYDAEKVGVPRADAEVATLKLVRSIALGHTANSANGWWGGRWQDALWAMNAGYAGWLMWSDLSATDQENVRRMVEFEANRLQLEDAAYYRDESGAVIRPGNSAAEENSWNATLLQLATAMMPDHPNWKTWMDKNLELMISAFSRPEDVHRDRTIINGKSLATWLRGSNIESNGVLINHSRVHPDYMVTFDFNLMAGAAYSLAGMPTPKAAFFNTDVVYGALVDADFPSPPYAAPGGTIYIDGSSDIYYPQGTDWGPTRRMIFANADVMASSYGLDERVDQKASYWEALHVGAALAQQQRHADGSMNEPGEFQSEPNDGAAVPARAYLTKWLTGKGLVKVTNKAYPVPPGDELEPARLTLDGPGALEAGRTQHVETSLENRTKRLTQVEMRLPVPDGWVAEPTTEASFRSVDEGATVATTWAVTVPPDAEVGVVDLKAEATFKAAGRPRSAEAVQQIWAAPKDRVPPAQISATATTSQPGNGPDKIVDDDLLTIWTARYRPYDPLPQSVTLNLGDAYDVTALHYQPRLDSPNGTATRYKVYASSDGANFAEVATGEWALDASAKMATFDAPGARYVRLEVIEGGGTYASAAEVAVVGHRSPLVITSFEAEPRILANPGDSTTLGVALQNRTASEVTADIELEIPDGWTGDPVRREVTLQPGAEELFTFELTSPDVATGADISAVVRIGDRLADGASVRVTSSLMSWEFERDGDTEGWQANNQLSDVVVRDGALVAAVTGGDAWLVYEPPLSINADGGIIVEVTMSTSGVGQLFWGTVAAPGFAEARSHTFAVESGVERTYEIRIPPQSTPLTHLRLDPTTSPGDLEIDAIRIVR